MTHPGKIIKDEYLRPRDWTPTELSRQLGVNHQQITKLVRQQQGITAEVAIRLSRLFTTTTPDYWMGLQSRFELDLAEGEMPEVAHVKRGPQKRKRRANKRQ